MDLKSLLFCASRDGNLELLVNFINALTKDEVAQSVAAKTHGSTPLVMACRNGHYDVAEYLIDKCAANVEQRGTVVFDGETIEDAPPLWCAAATGHLHLVQLLVTNGANVNSMTKTNSTPLRAACFDGHLLITEYLLTHGADIEMANRSGHTCLMIACFKGHKKIVSLLLDLKADVNRKSVKGNTALHDCAENGSLDILRLLLEHGALMDVDSYGMTPLLAAAVTGHTHIVKYLIRIRHLVNRKEIIDALELLGATFVDKKRNMIGALEFWKQAMQERYREDAPVIPKPPPFPAVAAYDFAQEISDPEALDDLLADPDEMRMQALVIRERILGPAHPDTSYYIRYRGAIFADAGMYNRCIELWNYALDMQQSMLEPLNTMTTCSLYNFMEFFSFMVHEEGRQTGRGRIVPPIHRDEIMRVFKKAILEVHLGKQMLDKIPASKREPTYLHRVLMLTLHLACLLIKKTPEEGTKENLEFHKVLYGLVRINAKGKQGRDVLQLIHSEDGALVGRYPACKFPPQELIASVIKVGADLTATDNDGNTALHFAALTSPWQKGLAVTLLDAGAHIDVVNNDGNTFETLLRDKQRYESVNPLKYTTLSCLAARVVRRTHRLNRIPKHFLAFVQMH